MKKIISTILLSLGLLPAIIAQNTVGQTGTKVITTAVPFLGINPDGASMGMAQTGIATEGTALGVVLNPAKMAFQKKGVLTSSTYIPWLRGLRIPDVHYWATAWNVKLNERHAVSVNYRLFQLGTINFVDNLGMTVGKSKPIEMTMGLSYAYKLNKHFSLGANLAWVNSALNNTGIYGLDLHPINSVAGGLGAYYQDEHKSKNGNFQINYSCGAALTNIGPKVSYSRLSNAKYFIPSNAGFGVAARMRLFKYIIVNPAVDFNKLLVPSEGGASKKSMLAGMLGSGFDAAGGSKEEFEEITYSLGGEAGGFIPFDESENEYVKILGRAGYFHENKLKGNRKFLTVGLGAELQIKRFVIAGNLSYLIPTVTNNPLQNTLVSSGTLGYLF